MNARPLLCALALAAFAPAALAQGESVDTPDFDDGSDDGINDAEPDDEPDDPPPPPPRPKPEVREPAAPKRAAPPPAADHRPQTPWAFGVGAGWAFPTDLLTPNTASVRIAFPGSVTLEPFARLSFDRTSNNSVVDDPNLGDPIENDAAANTLRVAGGTTARIPMLSRGNLDLQLLATGVVSHTSVLPEDDGDGDPVTSSSTTSASVRYGFGIEWFFLPNMALTADASNPLANWSLSHTETTQEVQFIDPDTGELETGERSTVDDTQNLNIGAIFSPAIQLMIHLYF